MSQNRRRMNLCLALIILSASLSSLRVATYASDHPVINEFELNPPGSDNYLSVEEWVELYNPTSADVDIGGWTLSTTSGDTVTVTIPADTVIPAGGYYVYSQGSSWLDNDGEAVVLRDAGGAEVDRTPAKSDEDNDDFSWARYPDGDDADWRFQPSTRGESNGGGPSPEPSPCANLPLSENVTVHFIDVGQGDAIFVDTPDQDMLIDAGIRSGGDTVVDYLQALGVVRIDVVVATHPDLDHIGGLVKVLTEYDITQAPLVIDSGYEKTTGVYLEYIALAKLRTVEYLTRGNSFLLDDGVNVTVLSPTSPLEFHDSNENSVVLRMKVCGVTFLFTGDAEVDTEESILESGLEVSADVMKLGHHGSSTSTTTLYLDAVDPDVVIICVGKGNQYEHPHEETIDKIEERGLTVGRTDINGDLVVTTDGVGYTLIVDTIDSPPNVPPIASFEWRLEDGTIFVDASGSSDEDGEIVDYVWYINDEEEETIKGLFSWEWADPPAGTHNVTLWVYDNLYGEGMCSILIEVESEEEPLKDLNIPGFPSISLLVGLGLSIIILIKSSRRI